MPKVSLVYSLNRSEGAVMAQSRVSMLQNQSETLTTPETQSASMPMPIAISDPYICFWDQAAAAPDIKSASLQKALAPVAPKLAELDTYLTKLLPIESQTSRAVIQHVFGSGGKRIRPALYFYCCEALGYSGPHYLPIAAVSEYVHTASLLHDDVVDNSTLRRCKPTSRTIWGDQASVLVGDLIYARASELMAQTGHLEIVTSFASAIRKMSEGELIQLENIFNPDIELSSYLKIIEFKTATLLAAACRSAAVLAGAEVQVRDALSDFGRNVGIAFQLIDDALDYLSDENEFGKKGFADLLEGKLTYPLLVVREKASPNEWQQIAELIDNHRSVSTSEITMIRSAIEKYDAIDKTFEFASNYTDAALAALDFLPDGEGRRRLIELSKTLLWRSY